MLLVPGQKYLHEECLELGASRIIFDTAEVELSCACVSEANAVTQIVWVLLSSKKGNVDQMDNR